LSIEVSVIVLRAQTHMVPAQQTVYVAVVKLLRDDLGTGNASVQS
jgi:hypothetical protein